MAGIVGFATALRLSHEDLTSGRVAHLGQQRDALQAAIVGELGDGVVVSATHVPRLASHLHLRFPGVRSDELLMLLDQHGLCASAGSACSSGASTISHVLEAMEVSMAEAKGALRLSLSTSTVDDDVEWMANTVVEAVRQLRNA